MTRLEELAIEAGLISENYNGFDRTSLSVSEKKFADLIIKEAYTVVTSNPAFSTSLAGRTMVEHFEKTVESTEILYSEKYDTYYDPIKDVWIEDRCSDLTCEFCANRPAKPSLAN